MKSLVLLFVSIFLILILFPIVFMFKTTKLILTGKKYDTYWYNLVLEIDRLGASVIYGRDGSNWTISSYSYLMGTYHNSKFNMYLSKFIDTIFFDKTHCEDSYNWEKILMNKEDGEK